MYFRRAVQTVNICVLIYFYNIVKHRILESTTLLCSIFEKWHNRQRKWIKNPHKHSRRLLYFLERMYSSQYKLDATSQLIQLFKQLKKVFIFKVFNIFNLSEVISDYNFPNQRNVIYLYFRDSSPQNSFLTRGVRMEIKVCSYNCFLLWGAWK